MTTTAQAPSTSNLLASATYQRYRIAAYVVGAVLAFMTVVGLPWKYLLGNEETTWYAVGWQLHGLLFMVYLVTVLDLAIRARWTPWRAVVVGVAGTIPFMSFILERRVRASLQATREGAPGSGAAQGSAAQGSAAQGSA